MTSSNKRRSLVEREAESFAQQKSFNPRRGKAVQPEWEDFQNMSFTEYVQHALFDDDADTSIEEENGNSSSSNNRKDKPRKIGWNHGVVKITLPKGWWDESGIGKDRTARGPAVSCFCDDDVKYLFRCQDTSSHTI
jgi:hypothetical protein